MPHCTVTAKVTYAEQRWPQADRSHRDVSDAGAAIALQSFRRAGWAKREEQLKGALDSTAGLYGDLQGIAGRAMADIESLDFLMIESTSAGTDRD